MIERRLIHSEVQAYGGAALFYYCFLPCSLLLIIGCDFGILLAVKRGWLVEQDDTNWGMTGIKLVLCLVSYQIAIHFHQLCHTTNISPVLPEKWDNADDRPARIYCSQCQILCDYRTKHCQKCRVCVERYDHHCFWIGNCVGRHNHRQFYYFLMAQTVNNVATLLALLDLEQLTGKVGIEFHWVIRTIWWSYLVLTVGFVLFTGCLLLYHSWLVSSGTTTWEHFSHSRISYLRYLPSYYRPFSQGIIANWRLFLTEPTRATDLNPPVQQWAHKVVPRSSLASLPDQCGITQNKYYSCC